MECNNHSYVTSDCSLTCTAKKCRQKFHYAWPWAYFANGPNAAASIAHLNPALNVLG